MGARKGAQYLTCHSLPVPRETYIRVLPNEIGDGIPVPFQSVKCPICASSFLQQASRFRISTDEHPGRVHKPESGLEKRSTEGECWILWRGDRQCRWAWEFACRVFQSHGSGRSAWRQGKRTQTASFHATEFSHQAHTRHCTREDPPARELLRPEPALSRSSWMSHLKLQLDRLYAIALFWRGVLDVHRVSGNACRM